MDLPDLPEDRVLRAHQAEYDPEGFAAEMRDAGRGHLVRGVA